MCLAIIFGGIASGVPWFLHSTAVPMQLPNRCRHCQCSVTVSAGTGVGRGSHKQPAIECLTSGLSRGMNAAIVTLGTIWPEDSKAAFEQKKRVSGRLGMLEGNNPLCPITPPSRHHLVNLCMPNTVGKRRDDNYCWSDQNGTRQSMIGLGQ